jgi:hypothetical protein
MGSGIRSFLALKLLFNILEKFKTNIADKAKPRVIVGRKATPACRNAAKHAGVLVCR